MATKEKMLTAVVQDRSVAVRVFNWLQNRGYGSDEINVLMTDRTREHFSSEGEEHITAGSMASEGMATGGAIGTAVGASLAAIAAIGTVVALPILGGLVVAGPIVAALAGGGAGAVTGGAIGGLIGLGISESNSKAYEEALRKGGVVFGVVPHSSQDAKVIQKYFEEQKADNIVYA